MPQFADPHFLTITTDPAAFGGDPGAAYDAIRAGRLIAVMLERFGLTRWVAVLEAQPGTGWPHWHVVVDGRVPIVALRAWWTKRVGSGRCQVHCHVQQIKGGSVCSYLSGYLAKGGTVPAWILARRSVHGLSCSRNLESYSAFLKRKRGSGALPDGDPEEELPEPAGKSRRGRLRRIGQRLDDCESMCRVELVRERAFLPPGTDKVVSLFEPEWVCDVALPWRSVERLLMLRGQGGEVSRVPHLRVDKWAPGASGRYEPASRVRDGVRYLEVSPDAWCELWHVLEGQGALLDAEAKIALRWNREQRALQEDRRASVVRREAGKPLVGLPREGTILTRSEAQRSAWGGMVPDGAALGACVLEEDGE